jgi:hypothetical protein
MPGRIAPHVMGRRLRMSGTAGPLSASGEASNGEPVQVELLINGVWTDITAYVMVRDNNGELSLTRGRRDEGGTADQATLQCLLNNRDGRFSPRNPTGEYYGLIGRNQPIRVSVPNGLGGKSYRFWGEISTWPQFWDSTGTDVWVELEASGIIRRLSQAPPTENSLIYDAITTPGLSGLRAYWPCEDPTDAVEIAAAVGSNTAMSFVSRAPELASSTLFGASNPLPVFTSAAMTGTLANYGSPSATQVRFLLHVPREGTSDLDLIVRVHQLVDISVSDHDAYELYYNAPGGTFDGVNTAGSLSLEFRSDDGLTLGTDLNHNLDVRGKRLRVSLEFEESGTSTIYTIRTLDLDTGEEVTVSQTRTTTQLTRCISVKPFVERFTSIAVDTATGIPGGVMGHITVQDTITPITDLGLRLDPAGEAAGRRVERLCGERGVAFESLGDLDSTVAMGGEEKLNVMDLLREAELADDGMLYETLAVMGIGYRTRDSLTNQDPQLTLNYEGFNLSEVPLPIEDDRYIQNSVTVTVNGFAQTYSLEDGTLSIEPAPAGVGKYGQDVTLNLEKTDEATLLDQAAWRVHVGTVDEARHPKISVNLAHSSFTANPALKQAVLGLRPGDRILVQNPPAWLPPDDIDQLILGFDETITHFEHRLTFICAPASPYRVGFLDADAARIDTDGSELKAAVDSDDTALTIVPTDDPTMLWTTSSAEFPLDVRMGGEVMRVTNITNWLTDTFTRTESSTWGTPDVGTAWSNVGGGSASDYSVNGSAGLHTLSTVNVSRRSGMSAASADFDIYCDVTTSDLATGASLYGGVTTRMMDANNMMLTRIEFTTGNAIIVTLRRIRGGTHTQLAATTLSLTHVAGTFIRVRFQGVGSTFRAKAWAAATDFEPPFWELTGTDTAHSQAGQLGTRSISDTGNTNAATVSVQYDNYLVTNPQTFTVTRSVNGVTKSHAAGSDIRLAFPTPLSL